MFRRKLSTAMHDMKDLMMQRISNTTRREVKMIASPFMELEIRCD